MQFLNDQAWRSWPFRRGPTTMQRDKPSPTKLVLVRTHHLDGELNRWWGLDRLEGVQDALLFQQAHGV